MSYDDLRFQDSNFVNDGINIQKNNNEIERNNDSLDTGNNSINDELMAFQNIGKLFTIRPGLEIQSIYDTHININIYNSF